MLPLPSSDATPPRLSVPPPAPYTPASSADRHPLLAQAPTLSVALLNVLITLLLTGGACAYIGKAGSGVLSESREAVERYFAVSSFAFFIGWMWLILARDVVVLFCEVR